MVTMDPGARGRARHHPNARHHHTAAAVLLLCTWLAACGGREPAGAPAQPSVWPAFTAAQPEIFSAPGGQPNAWTDYDRDGDLDLFVGFRGGANRLYRNDATTMVEVAEEVGLADVEETRAAAWGDYDADGYPDLYVGFAGSDGTANRLYRSEGGSRFVDVAPELGLDRVGATRQPVWIDFDGDGDLDLFVAFRDQANRMYRNEGGSFTDVTEASGLGDPRRTVGAVWFDMDGDADLDLFVANQNGDEDGVYRNLGDGRFEDVAAELGMSRAGRSAEQGSVGVAVTDYDNDGDLDLFVACYGPDVLWRNQGDGTFVDVAQGTPLAGDHHSVGAAWADVDHDGSQDLYVGTFLASEPQAPDHLFRNVQGRFEAATPEPFLERGASHGVAWADFDLDGDLDLALANNDPEQGSHPLYVNGLPSEQALRSLKVAVQDGQGRTLRPGARVTLVADPAPGHPDGYRSARLVDAGGGYDAQGTAPVHFGLPAWVEQVSVSVRWFERGEPREATVSRIDPAAFSYRWLELRLGVQ